MAEILVKAVNATNDNPTKDASGCYKRGDPVVVMPDGWSWGTDEVLPPADGGKFVIIKVTDVTVNQVNKYIAPEITDGVITRRRLWRIVVDELPAGVKNTLNQTGTYTTTWTQIRSFIENKLTLAREANVTP